LIETDRLSVVFGRTTALESLDIRLHPGVHGVFGPNGSGKSTLLRVVAGLLEPTRGAVTWDGTPVSAADERFRRRVGYAGHEAGLYARLTVEENLALFARLYGAAPVRVRTVAERLGIGEHLATPVHELSAGLKRRAAAARALLHDPELLLLDEPYANLDDDAADMLSDAVRQWKEPGRTALIATHGAKKLKGWADGGVVLRRGRLAVQGRYGSDHRFASEAPHR
jgi:heme ABC exporter ATP-binding subunit CcmA